LDLKIESHDVTCCKRQILHAPHERLEVPFQLTWIQPGCNTKHRTYLMRYMYFCTYHMLHTFTYIYVCCIRSRFVCRKRKSTFPPAATIQNLALETAFERNEREFHGSFEFSCFWPLTFGRCFLHFFIHLSPCLDPSRQAPHVLQCQAGEESGKPR